MGFGGVLLLLLAAITKKTVRVPRKDWADLTFAAVLNMTIFQIGMTLGVHYFSAGRTVVIVYTMPLWAMMFAWPLLGEIPNLKRVSALSLGLIGLIVLINQDFHELQTAYLGACCTLIGAISFGLGTVWMKRRTWSNDPTVIAGWQLTLGAIPVIPLWLLLGQKTEWSKLNSDVWLSFIFLILVANVVAYFAWFRVLNIFPASVSGLGTLAVPIVGLFASALVLGEKIGLHELLAVSLIISALLLNLRSR
tara:strand:- start:1965 stop:2714 length:750 start_codon:yes stop_codon:yes gene_type:complete